MQSAQRLPIKIKKLTDTAVIPKYQTPMAAGVDLCSDEHIVLDFGKPTLVKTGLAIELPPNFEAQIRPRSGLALKSGITVLNTPGTIDADYRGEIGIILMNTQKTAFTIMPGDRIAQMVIAPVIQAHFDLVDELSATERGEGGFGSTGMSVVPKTP